MPPRFEEDIYLLGALFVFMTTGICPGSIAGIATSEEIRERLFSVTNDYALASVISSCLSSRPEDRPLLHEVKYEIVHALHELIFNREQNGPEEQRRSEEHTSELKSLMRISYAVFCWKKKKQFEHRLL